MGSSNRVTKLRTKTNEPNAVMNVSTTNDSVFTIVKTIATATKQRQQQSNNNNNNNKDLYLCTSKTKVRIKCQHFKMINIISR